MNLDTSQITKNYQYENFNNEEDDKLNNDEISYQEKQTFGNYSINIDKLIDQTDIKNINHKNVNKDFYLRNKKLNIIDNKSNFWIYQPLNLFDNFDFLPKINQNIDDRLNVITKVIILLSIILFIIKFPYWYLFFILGISLIIIIHIIYFDSSKELFTENDTYKSIDNYLNNKSNNTTFNSLLQNSNNLSCNKSKEKIINVSAEKNNYSPDQITNNKIGKKITQ